jgi:hypothetical protein
MAARRAQAGSRGASRSSVARWLPFASFRIFLQLSAFVRIVARCAGGDRLTKRHTVKKVKKTRIQEVPEFRGPRCCFPFRPGFRPAMLWPCFGRFRPFFDQDIVTRCSGGRKEENDK